MKKSYLVGVSLVAMFAFLAVGAASAFAAIEWLVNNVALAAAVKSETEGELNLITRSGTTLENVIKCSGIFDGMIGPGAGDTVEKLLTLAQVEVTAAKPLSCAVVTDENSTLNCEAGLNAEVSAVNLPWTTTLELMTGTEPLLDVFTKEPGYEVKCKTLTGLTASSKCVATKTSTLEENEGATTPVAVLGTFNGASETGECTITKFTASEEGDGNTWAIGAELEFLATSLEL
jgi:hypothetical protein